MQFVNKAVMFNLLVFASLKFKCKLLCISIMGKVSLEDELRI